MNTWNNISSLEDFLLYIQKYYSKEIDTGDFNTILFECSDALNNRSVYNDPRHFPEYFKTLAEILEINYTVQDFEGVCPTLLLNILPLKDEFKLSVNDDCGPVVYVPDINLTFDLSRRTRPITFTALSHQKQKNIITIIGSEAPLYAARGFIGHLNVDANNVKIYYDVNFLRNEITNMTLGSNVSKCDLIYVQDRDYVLRKIEEILFVPSLEIKNDMMKMTESTWNGLNALYQIHA